MFHLKFPIPQSDSRITIGDTIVSLGSCFAENISRRLSENKFDCFSNPFGTIYNPTSICEILNNQIDERQIVENRRVYYHWQAHGEISELTKEKLLSAVSAKREALSKRLSSAEWLIITLGSAFAYRLKSSGKIVANCHKLPQVEFTKELLAIDFMKDQLHETFKNLRSQNPNLQIILTVSPVIHVRDGLIENNRSKARLIEVAQELSAKDSWVKYFPAYEIQISELRDYRFYAKDKVHPSEEAIDYIWGRFAQTYFDTGTQQFLKEWMQIRSAIDHRPFHPNSQEHQTFLMKTIERLNKLSDQVDVNNEVSLLEKQLLANT